MKYILVFAAAFTLTCIGLSQAGTATPAPTKIVLEKKNTLSLRDPFTGASVTDVQKKVLAMSSALSKNETIYLFLDTPGGSIVAGEQLISTLKALTQEVKTITNFAASMGFVTVQNLGERLILPNGILMSHRAYVQIEGQIPGEFTTQSQFWLDHVTAQENIEAARMGMKHEDYAKLIQSEYWVSGAKAVESKAADRVVLVQCGADLQGTSEAQVQTMFGPINVTWSDCPLLTYPVAINFDNLLETHQNTLEIASLKRVIYDTYNNKRKFNRDPILREAYYRYIK